VLFLDEITSALDTVYEDCVVNILRRELPDTVVFYISHSHRMKKESDFKIKVRAGTIVGVEKNEL